MPPTALPLLAEAGLGDLFVPTVVTLLVVAALIGAVAVIRKRVFAPSDADVAGGFALGGLRDLVRQGKMTQEEFDQAKAKIVEATHKAAARAVAEKAAAANKVPGDRRVGGV